MFFTCVSSCWRVLIAELRALTWGGCSATGWLVELPAVFLSLSGGAGVVFVYGVVGRRALLPFLVVGRGKVVL